jgi:hypothetical protein
LQPRKYTRCDCVFRMYEIFLILIVVVMILSLCLHHHTMKKRLFYSTRKDITMIREAANLSRRVSCSTSQMDAIMDVTKAEQIITSLHERYGPQLASEITEIDTAQMLSSILKQKENVITDILQLYPQMIPPHPFNEKAGYSQKKTIIRNDILKTQTLDVPET